MRRMSSRVRGYGECGARSSPDLRFNELRHKTSLLQESMTSQLLKHIEIVANTRQHTADSLKALRLFAEGHGAA